MCSIHNILIFFLVLVIAIDAIPMVRDPSSSSTNTDEQFIQKRLSNDALIRLLMRNRENQVGYADGLKRGGSKRADFERRSVDDEFSNCFLSPVQCMLPNNRK